MYLISDQFEALVFIVRSTSNAIYDVCVDTQLTTAPWETYKNCNSTSKINDEKTKREQPSLFTKHKPLLVFS